MEFKGTSIIGFERGQSAGSAFFAQNVKLGTELTPAYFPASSDDIARACHLAKLACTPYSQSSGAVRAGFFTRIAENIETLAALLPQITSEETALPPGRIQNEMKRTCQQLRLFADLITEGSWVDARIDRPDPNRQPAPRPELRSMLRPIGPVAIFCASNFPLAFSVAGGDTAAALAAGNPVVVMAHHAHPRTAELIGMAIRNAAKDLRLPDGVFSLLFSKGPPNFTVESLLVQRPEIQAVGFTGSREGGLALAKICAARPQPIPIFAEMSSINPVILLPQALEERGEAIAADFFASITLGSGQFCTKPGLVFVKKGQGAEAFAVKLRSLMEAAEEFTLLSAKHRTSYMAGLDILRQIPTVTFSKMMNVDANPLKCRVAGAIMETDAATFLRELRLRDEVFGPCTVVVHYDKNEELLQLVESLEGQLTFTVHGSAEELSAHASLVHIFETKSGRVVVNGFPTGVEVSHAMVHGGPFPATTEGRSSSVGTLAITRFCRPVCYQNHPQDLLPAELKHDNPLGIWRSLDGQRTR